MPNMKLKKLWRRKSVDITGTDPTFKVIYLGNVLTGWAKGEGCVEKPLATLWRNYCQSSRPDISMKVTICGAGLRAVTQEHGLTEYWAHRITYCSAHPSYSRVFCWVYRHEGRRLKQELRCHAVLCPKQGKAEMMAAQLKERLSVALHEFRREKTIRQNARLNVMNAVYDGSSVPLRKFYLVTGASNYRPPLERSKSAPKLSAIEEITEEEEWDVQTVPSSEASPSSVPSSPVDSILCNLRHCASSMNGTASSVPVFGSVSRVRSKALTSTTTPEPLFGVLGTSPLTTVARSSATDTVPSNVAFVYERVDDPSAEIDFSSRDGATCSLSPPNLVFYSTRQSTPAAAAAASSYPRPSSPSTEDDALERPHDELSLLESFKDKLGLPNGGEESLTSDQPESIGSHSCSSSSCDGGGDNGCEGDEPLLIVGSCEGLRPEEVKKGAKTLEDEDNISEESGYSEDKDCIPINV